MCERNNGIYFRFLTIYYVENGGVSPIAIKQNQIKTHVPMLDTDLGSVKVDICFFRKLASKNSCTPEKCLDLTLRNVPADGDCNRPSICW